MLHHDQQAACIIYKGLAYFDYLFFHTHIEQRSFCTYAGVVITKIIYAGDRATATVRHTYCKQDNKTVAQRNLPYDR
jgi:hypothetical protein